MGEEEEGNNSRASLHSATGLGPGPELESELESRQGLAPGRGLASGPGLRPRLRPGPELVPWPEVGLGCGWLGGLKNLLFCVIRVAFMAANNDARRSSSPSPCPCPSS